MTGQEILKEVRELLEDPGFSSFSEINRAYRRVCRLTKFNWLRTSSQSVLQFKADTASYQLDMSQMRVLQRIWVQASDDEQEWRLLEEVPPQLFESKVLSFRNDDGSDDTDTPEFYKIEGGQSAMVSVSPTPDATYTVRVDYIAYLQEVSRDADVPMPPSYLDTVASLAAGGILMRETNADRRQYGERLVSMATSEFEGLISDTHPNRTKDLDRPEQRWMT